MRGPRIFIGGRPATVEDLAGPALVNDGHFTTLQVRGHAVQGLDMHLQRLCEATRELFALAMAPEAFRDQLRAALDADGRADCTLRASVTVPGSMSSASGGAAGQPEMLVAISAPLEPPRDPVRVRSFHHERVAPHIKHAGTFDLFHHRRLALGAGYDDALFVDGSGQVLEGSTWNVGFLEGDGIVWPQGRALRGVTERLLQAGLNRAGVAQQCRPVTLDELVRFQGAFACNSRGVWMLQSVDALRWEPGPEWQQRLDGILSACAWTRV